MSSRVTRPSECDSAYSVLREKLADGSLVVGVVGLGHVGLPLALAFSKQYRVWGLDIRPDLIGSLSRGEPPPSGNQREELADALHSNFDPSTDFDHLSECDVVVIAVGTPLTEGRDPDLSQVERAAREVGRRLRPGRFIILESTSYPGTTEEFLVPILESGGLEAGRDFGVAYSPERIDPGNAVFNLETIPKLVGGLSPESTAFAVLLYSQIVRKVVPVSHARVAEAAKIIENVFRSMNIAFANEVALILEHLDVDAWEAIAAASTKPFGFMAFYPGPGVGGQCIPLNPYYLAHRARKAGHRSRFIEFVGAIDEAMRLHTLELLRRGLREAGHRDNGARVAILGLSFKKNVAETRESPAIRIIEECVRSGMDVRVYDPVAKGIKTRVGSFESSSDIEAAVGAANAAIILVDHDAFRDLDFDSLTSLMVPPGVWVDTRHVIEHAPNGSVALGIGRPSGRIPPAPASAVVSAVPIPREPARLTVSANPSDDPPADAKSTP